MSTTYSAGQQPTTQYVVFTPGQLVRYVGEAPEIPRAKLFTVASAFRTGDLVVYHGKPCIAKRAGLFLLEAEAVSPTGQRDVPFAAEDFEPVTAVDVIASAAPEGSA